MINHNFVLKLFWLKKHNSKIDWIKKKFQFKKCDCVVDIKFTYRQNSIINKKWNLKKITKNEFAISTKNDNIKKFDFLNIDDD